MTGLYAHSTGVYTNKPPNGGWPVFAANGLEARTIAVALHAIGYRTALIGKYLNGFDAADHVPPGWDVFTTFTTRAAYYAYTLSDGTSYGSEPEDYSTDVLRLRVLDFIRSTPSEQPLFLFFAPFGPHGPATPAPRHVGAWGGRLPSYSRPSVNEPSMHDKPHWLRGLELVEQQKIDDRLQSTQETLMSIDEAVGAIYDELEANGRASNTLFIYLSDNGLLLAEHRLFNTKNVPYDMATHVPMLMRWDGHLEPGSTNRSLALNVDLAATIASATGTTMETEGRNLLGSVHRTGFPLEHASWGHVPSSCGYRTSRYSFVRYATGFEELYDYRVDPQELLNRAGRTRYRKVVERLRGLARLTCKPKPPGFRWHPSSR